MAKCSDEILEKNITELNLLSGIVKILNENDICYIKDLWVCTRKKMKELGLKDSEIKDISIKMQLLGIDLNKKVYK